MCGERFKAERVSGWLLVDLAAMYDPRHAHDFCRVVDGVHYAPLVLVALQLFASGGPWSVAQSFKFRDDARESTLFGNASSSFRADGFTSTA